MTSSSASPSPPTSSPRPAPWRSEYFGRVSSLAVNSKGLQDVVTEADVAVENLIKDRLADWYPE